MKRTLVPLLVASSLLPACRDASDSSGRTLSGTHVLSGRPASAGGARISDDDLIAGFFESTDADLAPLQEHLRRTPLEVVAQLFGGIGVIYRGSIVEHRSPGGVVASRRHTSIDFHLSLGTLAAEYEALCLSGTVPVLAPQLDTVAGRPCLPFDLGALRSDIDEVTATLRRDEITVRWNLGRIAAGTDLPVLDIVLPFTVDVDPNDRHPVDPPTGTVEIVISAFPLPWNGTATPEFLDFHGPGRHASSAPTFLQVRAGDVRDFGDFNGIIRGALGGVLDRLDRVVGGAIGTSLGGIQLASPDDEAAWCASRPGGCPFSAATLAALPLFSAVDSQQSIWRLPDLRIVHLEGTNGSGPAWTNDTVDLIALGATPVTARMNPGSIADACERCGADPGDTAACAGCTACATTSDADVLALCAGTAIDVPVTAGFDPIHPVPAAPSLASLSQVARSIEDHISRAFATPLAHYNRNHPTRTTSYVEFLACPAAPSCPPGASGAVFMLAVDPDGDGFPFVVDNCPEHNPGQENQDGDAFGDICDLCPTVASDNLADLDLDGTPDACDCDVDEDTCNNRVRDFEGANICEQNGEVWDQEPRNANAMRCRPLLGGGCTWVFTNLDGGPDIDHCDADDDGDGWLDAPDNCPVDANPGQEDCNSDGIGDVCDDRCYPGWCTGIWCDRMLVEGIGMIEWLGLLPPLQEPPLCLVDGPDCWLLLTLDLLPDLAIATLWTDLDATAQPLDTKALGIEDLTTAVAVPDLDRDGYRDLVFGVPSRDELVAVSSSTRQRLWTWAIPVAGEAGSALASAGDALWIGVPKGRRDDQDAPGAVLRVGFLDGYPRIERIVWGDQDGDRFGTTITAAAIGDHARAFAGDAQGGFAILDGDGERLADLDGLGAGAVATLVDDGAKLTGIAIGMPTYGGGAGAVVFHDLGGGVVWKVTGGAKDALGTAVTFLDTPKGRAIVAGAPGNDGYLIALSPSGVVLGTALGAKGAGLGHGVARLDDLDSDGSAELAVEYAGEWTVVSAP